MLRLTASGIRRERTGVHAVVGVWWDRNQLEYDNFNIERNEERRKLARGSWNLLPDDERGIRNNLPLEILKAELDLFCEGLWAAHIGRVEVEPMRAEEFHQRRMIGPYLVEEGGTILFGSAGGGKSWLTYLIAQSMNTGSTKVWPSVRDRYRPLLINLERSRKDVESRLWTINRTLGVSGEDYPLDVINGRGMSLKDVEGSAQRHIEKHGNNIVFLDSISRIGLGSMNKDEVANEGMDMLNRLCPTWFAIAHQAKGGSDPLTGERKEASTFGSVMWAAACDLEVGLSSESSPGRIIVDLYVRKKNIPLVSTRETLYLEMDQKGLFEVLRPDDWERFKKTG